ncbi:Ig-like domain-containing protein, partial [Rhodanobacter glycinis]
SIDLSGSITGVDITAVTIGTAPTHGTVSVSGKVVTYTPSATYYGGTDSFTYTATNPGGTSSPATVTITVGVPAAPTVAAKSISTAYNTAATIDLTGSITGVDITGVTIGTAPTHGTVSVSGKTVTYTPSSSYYGGSDSFTYTATNPGGTSAPAIVSITVGLPAAPTVTAKNVTTVYNTPASIDLSGAITGVDITSVAIASAPSHGTVSVSGKTVTYTPSSTYYGGTDSFTYTATNPGGTSTPATVTMTVTPLSVPTAQALSVTTTTGASVQIQATAGATGPAPFTGVSVAQVPAHGQATASGEQLTYTPATGFTGTDHFTYRIANHFGQSAAATVTVTVTAAGQASAPDGTVTLTTKPNAPVTTNLGNIVPGSFVSSTVLGLSPGGAGQVSISQPTSLTFTSVAGFHGLAQITVLLTAADGHTATVDVLVLVSNQPDPSKNPDVLGLVNAQAMEAQRFAQSQLDNIRQRLESLHDGNQQLFSSTLSMSLNGKPLQGPRMAGAGRLPGQQPGNDTDHPNGLAATTQPDGPMTMRPGIGSAGDNMMMMSDAAMPTSDSTGTSGGHAPPSRGPNGLAAWIDGTAAFGSYDSYRQAAGFDANSIAINTGIDQRVGERGLFGISLGYNHDQSTVANDGTRSIARGYSAAIYGSFAPSAKTYIDAVLGGGGLSFDSRRRDSNDGSYLLGHRNGNQWFGSLTAGYEYHHQRWMISPYGRLEWSYSALNGFAENGDVADALTYGRQNIRTSLAVLGVRTSGLIVTTHAVLVPRARLEIGHEFQGTSDTTLSYAFVPSAGSWNVLSNPYSANGNSVQAGLGLDIQLPRSLTLTTDYSFLMQPHSHSQMIRFGLNKKF